MFKQFGHSEADVFGDLPQETRRNIASGVNGWMVRLPHCREIACASHVAALRDQSPRFRKIATTSAGFRTGMLPRLKQW